MKYLIKSKNLYVDILVIIIGSFISSLGVNLFLSNAKLLSGGVTGIALILQYFWNYSVFIKHSIVFCKL